MPHISHTHSHTRAVIHTYICTYFVCVKVMRNVRAVNKKKLLPHTQLNLLHSFRQIVCAAGWLNRFERVINNEFPARQIKTCFRPRCSAQHLVLQEAAAAKQKHKKQLRKSFNKVITTFWHCSQRNNLNKWTDGKKKPFGSCYVASVLQDLFCCLFFFFAFLLSFDLNQTSSTCRLEPRSLLLVALSCAYAVVTLVPVLSAGDDHAGMKMFKSFQFHFHSLTAAIEKRSRIQFQSAR